MTIKTITGKKTRYYIENERGETVAYFDSLDIAGVVLRYLSGAFIHKKDAETARAAMQEYDNRNRSKGQ